MSLRLYLDESASSHRVVALLRGAPWGHEVETPLGSGALGWTDAEHLAHARQRGLIMVTKNPADVGLLHDQIADHRGILGIYQDNRSTDLSAADIARAIGNLEAARVRFAGAFFVLNAWNW